MAERLFHLVPAVSTRYQAVFTEDILAESVGVLDRLLRTNQEIGVGEGQLQPNLSGDLLLEQTRTGKRTC